MTAPNTLPPLEGGCLCGAVRYRATPDHREGYYCHCRMCQLGMGTTRATWFNLRKTEVQWLSAPAYYASSKFARRGFCSHCGTPMSFEFLDSERMDLSVGSLDEPSALKPIEHTAIESCVANWHVPDGLPESRLDTNPRMAQRWRDAYGDAEPGAATARSG
ncbi:MAG: GFA family protein [Pseudomonadota bacterium]